jgi:hypothetical protein
MAPDNKHDEFVLAAPSLPSDPDDISKRGDGPAVDVQVGISHELEYSEEENRAVVRKLDIHVGHASKWPEIEYLK